MDRKGLGGWGENAAKWLLIRKGYHILRRNFRCGLGEIDIVAARGRVVVFAEVRVRGPSSFASPEETITKAKKERMRRLALYFIRKYRMEGIMCRFDVVCIERKEGFLKSKIRHIEDAF